MVELDCDRATAKDDGVRLLGDQRSEIQHLEDPVERDQCGHHVDVHVRQSGERTIETSEQCGERDDGADLETAVHREHASPAVHECRRERRGEDERQEEDPAVHRRLHADVADTGRATSELLMLDVRTAEQLDEQSTRDIEALRHRVVHLGVEVVGLPGQKLQLAADPACREDEEREQQQGDNGDLPREERHDRDGENHGDEVADDRGERVGEGLLCSENVVVQSGDESTGLGAREERERHLLDVTEDLLAHVVYQSFADARRDVALSERQQRINERQAGEEQGKRDDQVRVVPGDAPVDDLAIDQRVPHPDEGVDDDDAEKDPEHPPVRRGEPHDPADGAGRKLLLGNGAVPHERPHAGCTMGRAASRSHLSVPPSRMRRPRLGSARTAPVVRPAAHRQQPRQLTPLLRRQGAEGRFGRSPARLRDPIEQKYSFIGERNEDRTAVTRIGRSRDELGRLEVVHDRGRRPGHDLEGGRDVGHPRRVTHCHEVADDPRLGSCQPHRTELGHRAAPQPPGGPHEQLGELSDVLGVRRGVFGRTGHPGG